MANDFLFQTMSEKEIEIQNKVLELFDKNAPELAENVKKKIRDIEAESRLKISFVGQHNAGKSTIVSALTKNKNIKISSNVETDETASYEWNDVLLFDTPGLYAGVKSTHDASALEAIKVSDILVFCITSSLFDDLMIQNFIDLAYKKSYKNKIILVVNKMSQEDGDYDELKENYTKTLRTTLEELGGNFDDFPVAFIDAKDYKDGIDDDDDELIELSHFDSFITLLNEQIMEKGLLAKVGTKCTVLLDAMSEALASTGTEMDKNMAVILKRLTRTIRTYRKEMKYETDRIVMDLRSSVIEIGSELTNKIGTSEIKDEDTLEINNRIEQRSQQAIEEIEKILSSKTEEMQEEIGDVLASEIGAYVFTEIATDKVKAETITAKNYAGFVEKYGNVSKMAKATSERVVSMALTKGATDFSKLASSSGSAMHSAVKIVGHFFGVKFKPWQALKIANGIGKVAKFAGPLFSAVDLLVTAGSKIKEEQELKKIQEAKAASFNQISGIASDIVTSIEKQYSLMEVDVFDKTLEEIDEIRNSMVAESQNNTEFISGLKEHNEELKVLVNEINTIDLTEIA